MNPAETPSGQRASRPPKRRQIMRRFLPQAICNLFHRMQLSEAAKAEERNDAIGLPAEDPGIDRVIEESIAWLCRAQDRSASADGGVARHYSLITGWGSSYPETTGYIVPTLLTYAREH